MIDGTLSRLGFGASSLGAEFHEIDIDEAIRCVHVALELGINFIDTSPYYGRGMSEILLGRALRGVNRSSYLLQTKLGRYAPDHFDFSASRVAESIDVSLQRMKTDYLDVVLCHDVEFVDLEQILQETIPAMRRQVELGKVRAIGISGYPMKVFKEILSETDLDIVMTYNHYTLQNDMALELVPLCQEKSVTLINAAPFSARLLTNLPLPAWHKATPEVRDVARRAAQYCERQGVDIAKLALQFSLANPDFASCVVGTANTERVKEWIEWSQEPVDEALLTDVLKILEPIHNWFYVEGRPENNDTIRSDRKELVA